MQSVALSEGNGWSCSLSHHIKISFARIGSDLESAANTFQNQVLDLHREQGSGCVVYRNAAVARVHGVKARAVGVASNPADGFAGICHTPDKSQMASGVECVNGKFAARSQSGIKDRARGMDP